MTRFSIKIKDILQLSFYRYEITPSTLNPTIDTAFTVTVKCTNVKGNSVTGKDLILYYDDNTQGTQTTDANGEATWTITPSQWGLHTIKVSNQTIQVNVLGTRWRNATNPTPTWNVGRNESKGIILLNNWATGQQTSSSGNWATFGTYAQDYAPNTTKIGFNSTGSLTLRVLNNGTIEYRATNGTISQGAEMSGQIEWTIKDNQR